MTKYLRISKYLASVCIKVAFRRYFILNINKTMKFQSLSISYLDV